MPNLPFLTNKRKATEQEQLDAAEQLKAPSKLPSFLLDEPQEELSSQDRINLQKDKLKEAGQIMSEPAEYDELDTSGYLPNQQMAGQGAWKAIRSALALQPREEEMLTYGNDPITGKPMRFDPTGMIGSMKLVKNVSNLVDPSNIKFFEKAVTNSKPNLTIVNPEFPIDQASRITRANDMGFKTKAYHGTKGNINEFEKDALGTSTNAASAKQGFFFAADPSTASDYSILAPNRQYLKATKELNKIEREMEEISSKLKVQKDPKLQKRWNELADKLSNASTYTKNPEHITDAMEELQKKARELGYSEEDAIKYSKLSTDHNGIEYVPPNLQEAGKIILDRVQRRRSYLGHLIDNDKKLENISKAIDDAHDQMRIEQKLGTPNQKKIQTIRNQIKNLEKEDLKRHKEIREEVESMHSNVMPVRLKMDNPYIHDFGGQKRDITYYDIMKKAKELGHDSVIFKNTYDPANPKNKVLQDIYSVFEPNQIRSEFADFDPKKISSSDILAGIAGAGLVTDQLNNSKQQEVPGYAMGGRVKPLNQFNKLNKLIR